MNFKYRYLLVFLFTAFSFNFGQIKGLVENFDDGNLSRWQAAHERTFQLSAESGTLKINYTRTASSDMWDNFNYSPPTTIDVTDNPVILIRIKSTVTTTFAIKPTSTEDVPLISNTISGDNTWRTVKFNVNAAGSKKFNRIYMYFDGGSTEIKSGTVWFDEIRMGDSTAGVFPADWSAFDRALNFAQLLVTNSVEGSSEGTFPAGSKSILQSVINSMITLKAQNTKDQKIVDKATWDLTDACVKFEISANTTATNLVDKKATKQTKYLYLNMGQLQQRSILFGMHDVTGYGVGWSGDDVRSDVKDVCGDYPALFSEDINNVELDNQVDRMRTRLTNAYNTGSVITMCWHQYDPDGVGFYFADAKGTRVVANLLPGGSRNKEYKEKLYKIAGFFKTLRGSKGENIPIIFRPYHEHSGNAFWWGPGLTTTLEYNQIWQYTQNYLRDSLNVHNLIYALSPMLYDVDSGDRYFNIYPGDNYVDIFGADYYFDKSNTDVNPAQMVNGLRVISTQAKKKNKISALTEVGQENLAQVDWFTKALLNPIKADTVANNIIYAAVWRNASVSHHFAPYPGDATVPDFLKFYNDPFTLFQSDLPKMYEIPAEDKVAPVFISKHDTLQMSTKQSVSLSVETNERSFLRFSQVDEPYDAMKNQFSVGEGSFKHSVTVQGKQGEISTLYVRAADVFGNKNLSSLRIQFKVDTLQAPVAWNDLRYPDKNWKTGKATLGTDATVITKIGNVRAAYFRKLINLEVIPTALAVTVKSYGGAALYVNGNEVGRINLPDQISLIYNTDPTTSNAFTKNFVLNAAALSSLKKGQNLIAVEVHNIANGTINSFDVQIINQSYQVIMPFGAEWNYFDSGVKPQDVKLGDITGLSFNQSVPVEYNLTQNYPNPFNPSTVISYQLPVSDNVNLVMFDVLGREVATLVNEYQQAGIYRFTLNSNDYSLASGVYFYKLVAGKYSSIKKMILIK